MARIRRRRSIEGAIKAVASTLLIVGATVVVTATAASAQTVLDSIDLYSSLGPGPVINVCRTVSWTATGNYSNGTTANLTSRVHWISSNPLAAPISNHPSTKGVATGLDNGGPVADQDGDEETLITVTYHGLSYPSQQMYHMEVLAGHETATSPGTFTRACPGITVVEATVIGAGGSPNGVMLTQGGVGAAVSAELHLAHTASPLTIVVGNPGSGGSADTAGSGGTSEFGSGGNGGQDTGGGGSASGIFVGAPGVSTAMIVAGGGGGNDGGPPFGPTGGDGGILSPGGTGSEGSGGGGATETTPGKGGASETVVNGDTVVTVPGGSPGSGPDGGAGTEDCTDEDFCYGGAGGGGGWFGGGGAGYEGGGGGGSSYVRSTPRHGVSASLTGAADASSVDGSVMLTW